MECTVALKVPLNNTKQTVKKKTLEYPYLQYDFSWHETTLECGHVHPSGSCGTSHERNLNGLLGKLEGTSEAH